MAAMLERRFGVITAEIQRLALELLVPAIAANDPVAIQAALNEIEARINGINARDVEAAARDVASRVSKRNRRLFLAGLAAAVGMSIVGDDEDGGSIPTLPALPGVPSRRRKGVLVAKLAAQPQLLSHQFATKNAQLIKSLSSEVVPALRDEIVRAVQFGIDPEEAAQRLRDKWSRSGVPIRRGNLEPRVRLIVRDQVAKLNADLLRARSEAAGLTHFTWVSMRDSRVRPLHREIDGQDFSFAAGHPTEGRPGEPVNCRCIAVPVVNEEQVMMAPGFVNLSEASAVFEVAS